MSPEFELLEGAIFISDAHYSDKIPALLPFLESIASQKIEATQLILMGDIFDLLFGQIPLTHKRNAKAIACLNSIASHIEVYYLEGNHDYTLSSIFPHIRCFSLQEQPITCSFKEQKVLLAHGDIHIAPIYSLYATLIRQNSVMWMLRALNAVTRGWVMAWLEEYLDKKDNCNSFVHFETYIKRRIKRYKGECDYFIEGHFHQNRAFDIEDFYYINLDAFACYQRYFIVKSSKQERLVLQDRLYKEK